MKLHALMVAAALAFAGTAFAQSSYGTAPAPADASASGSMSSQHAAQTHHKKVAKAKKAHARHHASAMHHGQHMHASAMRHGHQMHARAHMDHRNTRAMGAGAASPVTDLDARARDDRMNSAYDDWQRLQARR